MIPHCANQYASVLRRAARSPRVLCAGWIGVASTFALAVSAPVIPHLIDGGAKLSAIHVAAVDRAEMLRRFGAQAGADIQGLACWRDACLVIALTAFGRGNGGAA